MGRFNFQAILAGVLGLLMGLSVSAEQKPSDKEILRCATEKKQYEVSLFQSQNIVLKENGIQSVNIATHADLKENKIFIRIIDIDQAKGIDINLSKETGSWQGTILDMGAPGTTSTELSLLCESLEN